MKAKAIQTNAVIGTIRSKVDGSIGFTVSTPELTAQEKALFFELTNISVDLTIVPRGEIALTHQITREVHTKTPSQRLRTVLYVLWNQKQVVTPFEQWYESEMEQFIEIVKEQLDNG